MPVPFFLATLLGKAAAGAASKGLAAKGSAAVTKTASFAVPVMVNGALVINPLFFTDTIFTVGAAVSGFDGVTSNV